MKEGVGMNTFTVMIDTDCQLMGLKVRAVDREDAELFARSLSYDDVEKMRKHPRVVSVWFVEDKYDF
jgi:hypothetical protein